jgi:serine/threonine protein kinase
MDNHPHRNAKYRVINLLGSGSFGTVTLVKDNRNNNFAMKKIKFEDDQEGLSTAVLREISILLELSHRNIVRLYTLDYSWEGIYKFATQFKGVN